MGGGQCSSLSCLSSWLACWSLAATLAAFFDEQPKAKAVCPSRFMRACEHTIPVSALRSTTGHLCSVFRWLSAHSPHLGRLQSLLCSDWPHSQHLARTGLESFGNGDLDGLSTAGDPHSSIQELLGLVFSWTERRTVDAGGW